MAILHGISIADPAKKSLSFTKIEKDHFDETMKEDGKPLAPFVSEQDTLNNFPRFMPSVRPIGYTVKECTIPMTLTLNNEMLAVYRQRKANLWADVEKPQLEADKYLVDEGMNRGAYFDPKGAYPESTATETSRPALRTIRDPASRLSSPYDYAREVNYVYVRGYRSYQDRYVKNSTWKDAKGRISLFERPTTKNWA